MPYSLDRLRHCLLAILLLLTSSLVNSSLGGADDPLSAEETEFFESRIRPVLIERCYECHHSAGSDQGGLALDSRHGMEQGGDSGPILDRQHPAASRLLAILRHEVDGLEMPQDGPRLDAHVIADFEKWIAMGAPDPRTSAPSSSEIDELTSWPAILERRKRWWSFQPIVRPTLPATGNQGASSDPIDLFIRRRLDEAGLEPSPAADSGTLVRRLYFALIGMPPSADEAMAWTSRLETADEQKRGKQIEQLIDQLLESPHFGERWARHCMDWLRYAESHGSEGDPKIENGWLFRDYLIRALNDDVSYKQLVRELIAGDLLEDRRTSPELGIDESIIGAAHWRMVYHGFAPTDALEERVRFTDDQINVFSKAFLGLTVSCARCHDHKFDAISHRDYYALFGVFDSCRPGRAVIDLPEKLNSKLPALIALKSELRAALSSDWLRSMQTLDQQLLTDESFWNAASKPESLLHSLFKVREALEHGATFEEAWVPCATSYRDSREEWADFRAHSVIRSWNLANQTDRREWFGYGAGIAQQPQPAGEFAVTNSGPSAILGIYPAGVYSHTVSDKLPARLTSMDFQVGKDYEVVTHAIGSDSSSFRYVVQNYPRKGTVYPVAKLADHWGWRRQDLSYWEKDEVHLEFVAALDAPLLVQDAPRSWFGVREVIIVPKGAPVPIDNTLDMLEPLMAAASVAKPTSFAALQSVWLDTIRMAIEHWRDSSASDGEAMLLDACIRQGLLPNTVTTLFNAGPLIKRYRALEQEIPVAIRVPGLDETVGKDHPLYLRGDHRRPSETVPRRFLEAIDPTPYQGTTSGRLRLAEDVIRDDNPLTRRVIVNRVWHHLFGRGLVSTPDNFGRLGSQPTHPELLDWLAVHFSDEGWSLKRLIRLIVTSETWQRSTVIPIGGLEIDPDNQLLARAHVKRLEAEAIRDSILRTSGMLDTQLFGEPVQGSSPRRSIYVGVVRNSLDPFLRVFDFPEPFSTTGRRDQSNVPAQSLTLMNDPQMDRIASAWSDRILNDGNLVDTTARIQKMWATALSRQPTPVEIDRIEEYLEAVRRQYDALSIRRDTLRNRLAAKQMSAERILAPVEKRLVVRNADHKNRDAQPLPQPIGRWEFNDDLEDQIGSLHGVAHGGATIEGGMLLLDGNGHVTTGTIQKDIREKTLEVWLQLADLTQRGGGVMTIQTPDGKTFDSIVFGEKTPRQWLAGSDHFSRTSPFDGNEESDNSRDPVHIAVAYHADGRVVGYRNGQPYGKPFQSNGPMAFNKGESIISFGVRHLPATGNRLLSGRIDRAQLYDQALSSEEIARSSKLNNLEVAESELLAALQPDELAKYNRLNMEITRIENELTELDWLPKHVDERVVWSDLAKAIFNFKEFIYIR